MSTSTTEQKKSDSVQSNNPSAGDLQKKKPSNKTEGSLQQPTTGDDKKSSDTHDVKSHIYSMGKDVPTEYSNQLKIVEGIELLLAEKKDRRFFLQEMTKPIPREQRKLGKKSPVTNAQRRAAKIEIRHLDLGIFNLEEDHRTATAYMTKLVNEGKSSLDDQILKDRSQSEFYLRRNKKRIVNNITALFNEVRVENIDDVVAIARIAKQNGVKAREQFQDLFIDFLRRKRYPLYILCTGRESFKQDILRTLRNAVRTWNPRRGELSL